MYGKELEIVNRYKYLGYTLTTKLSSVCACEDFARKAKGKIFDLMRTMWSLGSFDTTVFFQLLDAQIKPMFCMFPKFGALQGLQILKQLIFLPAKDY